jgi:hypothetical protein
MTNYNNENLHSLHNALTSIHPEQDRSNFAPKLAGDIHILISSGYLTFNTIDSDGIIWVVSDIDGWWTLSDSEIPDIQRGFDDGSFDISGRFLARNMTITGSILIQSNDRAEIARLSQSARSQLLQAFALIKKGTWLIVDEDEYHRSAWVRLSGRPDLKTVNSKGRIDFSIGLRASDPIKYEWIDNPGSTPITSSIFGAGYNVNGVINQTPSVDYRYYNEGVGENGLEPLSGYTLDANIAVSKPVNWQVDLPTEGYRVRGYDDTYQFEESPAITISATSVTGSVATITTNTTVHNFTPGDVVSITNLTASSGSADYIVTGTPSSTTFTIDWPLGTSITLGSSPTVRSFNTRSYQGNTYTAAEETSADSATIVNHGDANVFCIIRVVGPLFGPATITNRSTNQSMVILQGSSTNNYQVLGPTPSDNTVEYLQIDTKTREVHIGNYADGESTVSSRGLLEPLVDWIYLQPGDNTFDFNDDGIGSSSVTPSIQIYWRSGWIG